MQFIYCILMDRTMYTTMVILIFMSSYTLPSSLDQFEFCIKLIWNKFYFFGASNESSVYFTIDLIFSIFFDDQSPPYCWCSLLAHIFVSQLSSLLTPWYLGYFYTLIWTSPLHLSESQIQTYPNLSILYLSQYLVPSLLSLILRWSVK